GQRAFELRDRLGDLSASRPQPTEVQVREVPRLVPGCLLGLLEPGNRALTVALLNEVTADVVVGIAEGGIRRDGFAALLDRLREPAREEVGPAAERVCLGRR